MSRNNYYITRNLLDYFHQEKFYKLKSVDLSRQTNVLQQIHSIGRLKEDDEVIIF